MLGSYYKNGVSVAQDEKEAANLYHMAAEQGYAIAQQALGEYYEEQKNYDEAIKWYTAAADQGFIRSQLDLGNLYYRSQYKYGNYNCTVGTRLLKN